MVDVARIEITAEDKASPKVDRVSSSVDRLKGSYDRFVKDVGSISSKNELISNSMKRLDDTLATHAKGLLIAGAAYLGTSATIDKMRGAIDGMDKIDELSQKLSLNSKVLQEQAYVGKLSGVSLDEMAVGQKKLQTNMLEAITGGKEQTAVFKAMNVSVVDARGNLRKTEDVLLDVADVFHGLEDGPTKTALAIKLLGRSGQEMIPFLNEGRVGINRLSNEARDLGLIMGKDALKAAADFNDQLDRMKALSNASFANLANAAIPALNNVMERFVEASKVSDSFFERMKIAGGMTVNKAMGENYHQQIQDVNRDIQNLQTSKNPFNVWAKMFGDGSDAKIKDLEKVKKALQGMQALRALEGNGDTRDANDRRLEGKPGVNAAAIAKSLKDSKNDEKDKVTDYERLTRSINEKIAVEKLELEVGNTLTEGQKLASKFTTDLRDNVIKLSTVEKQRVTNLFEQLITEEKKVEILKASRKAAEDLAKHGADQLKSLKEETDKQREHNDEIGLSKEQIERLAGAKLELAAANDRELAGSMRSAAHAAGPLHDAYIQYADDLLKAADAKDRLAGEKRVGGARTTAAEEEEKALEARKRSADEIERGLIEGITNGFREGDSLADIFFEQLKVQAAKTILSPILRPVADATNSVIESLIGNIGGALLGAFGGLTVDPTGIGVSATASAGGLAAQDLIRGGRAGGGPVGAGELWEVNEKGPEMLSVDGRDYLMMGSQPGNVTPNSALGGSTVLHSQLTVYMNGKNERGQDYADMKKVLDARDAQLIEKLKRARMIGV